MTENIVTSNKLSPLVNYRLPEFVRLDHPTMVSFLTAYYEWLETQQENLRYAMDLNKVGDIDKTFDQFISYFKKQYLLDFPESLAFNASTGQAVSVKTLIKNIKEFYKSKGTEKTYEFLFRILYDTSVEFYYPKIDILRASDGKWIQKKTIRISSSSGNTVFSSLGRKISQTSASASISEINKFQLGPFEITELSISGINGNFNTQENIVLETSTGTITEPRVYSVVSSITINSGGSGYKVGEQIVFTNATQDTGLGAKAKISQVSSIGKIIKIKIENFGVNYVTAPTITIDTLSGSGASLTAVVGAICNYEGYYANNDGKLSSNKVLQDSHYYQNYSYVLKTEVVVDRYKEIIKRLIHPAGLGFFGQVLIKRSIKSNPNDFTTLSRFEVPLLGHYQPYTPLTYENLQFWYGAENNGGQTQGFDPVIDNPIMEVLAGNPIDAGGLDQPPMFSGVHPRTPAGLSGFVRADPFWIVYQHPNRRITAPVNARISQYQKSEFVNEWSEWTLTGGTSRSEWGASFTGDYKYANLQYDSSTEFRKITLRGFLTMPVGDGYDTFDSRVGYTGGGRGVNFN